MRKVQSVYINGVWLSIGGNTPFQAFLPKGKIKCIEFTESDNGNGSTYINIHFDDGYVLEVKTNDYMIVDKS